MTAPTSGDPALPESDPGTVVDIMWKRDTTAHQLGVTVQEAALGSASCAMEVTDQHLGSHGVVHGGLLFAFADIAMSYAGNSYNIAAVATGASINFVAAAHGGETLVAEAVEHHKRGKSAIYDVTIRSASDQRLVATFRGTTLQVGGSVTDPSAPGFA